MYIYVYMYIYIYMYTLYICMCLVVWNIFYFPISWGISSSQLTNSMIFQRGWRKHQADNHEVNQMPQTIPLYWTWNAHGNFMSIAFLWIPMEFSGCYWIVITSPVYCFTWRVRISLSIMFGAACHVYGEWVWFYYWG